MDIKRGYCIIATGDPVYFQMAFQLAIGMRWKHHSEDANLFKDPVKYPIVLLTDGAHLNQFTQAQKEVFDKIIKLKGVDNIPFYSKVRAIDYSPFDETVLIDASALCWNNPDWIFDTHDGKHIGVIPVKGPNTKGKPRHWAKVDLWDHYGFPDTHQFQEINSKVLYFDKSDIAKGFFRLSEYYMAENYLATGQYDRYGGYYPDELTFEIAMLALNWIPEPINNAVMLKKSTDNIDPHWTKCARIFSLMGIFGNAGNTHAKCYQFYNMLAVLQARQLSLQKYGKSGILGDGWKFRPGQKIGDGVKRPPAWNGLRARSEANDKDISELIERLKQKLHGTGKGISNVDRRKGNSREFKKSHDRESGTGAEGRGERVLAEGLTSGSDDDVDSSGEGDEVSAGKKSARKTKAKRNPRKPKQVQDGGGNGSNDQGKD